MARPTRDHVMAALCTATTAAELINWHAGGKTGKNDGTICKGIRLLFPLHTVGGRIAFRAVLGGSALWLCGHVERGQR
jgi:hypothetical protein